LAEERAEYKKTMLPYVLGAVILFSAVNITQFFYEFVPKESIQKHHLHTVGEYWYDCYVIYTFAAGDCGHKTIEEVDACPITGVTTTKEYLLDAIWGTQYILNNWDTKKTEYGSSRSKSDLEACLNVMKGWLKDGFGIDPDTVIFTGGVEVDQTIYEQD